MDKQQFETILEEAGVELETLVANLRELTVEDFEELDEDMRDVMVGVLEHSEEDLSDTAVAQLFAEQEEGEGVRLNESIVTSALEGNILDTQQLFNQALQERIDSKLVEFEQEVRSSLFEADESLTIADFMAEQDLSLEDMIGLTESLTDEEFETLEEESQSLMTVFGSLFEALDGDEEALEFAINENLLTELSNKTLARYVGKASRHEKELDHKIESIKRAKSANYDIRDHLRGTPGEKKSHELDDELNKASDRASSKQWKRRLGVHKALKRISEEPELIDELSKKTLGHKLANVNEQFVVHHKKTGEIKGSPYKSHIAAKNNAAKAGDDYDVASHTFWQDNIKGKSNKDQNTKAAADALSNRLAKHGWQ